MHLGGSGGWLQSLALPPPGTPGWSPGPALAVAGINCLGSEPAEGGFVSPPNTLSVRYTDKSILRNRPGQPTLLAGVWVWVQLRGRAVELVTPQLQGGAPALPTLRRGHGGTMIRSAPSEMAGTPVMSSCGPGRVAALVVMSEGPKTSDVVAAAGLTQRARMTSGRKLPNSRASPQALLLALLRHRCPRVLGAGSERLARRGWGRP